MTSGEPTAQGIDVAHLPNVLAGLRQYSGGTTAAPPSITVAGAFRFSLQSKHVLGHYGLVKNDGQVAHLQKTRADGGHVSYLALVQLVDGAYTLDGILADTVQELELTRSTQTLVAANLNVECVTMVLRDMATNSGIYRRYGLVAIPSSTEADSDVETTVLVIYDASGLVEFARGMETFEEIVRSVTVIPGLHARIRTAQDGLPNLLAAVGGRSGVHVNAASAGTIISLGHFGFTVPENWGIGEFSTLAHARPSVILPRTSIAQAMCIVFFPPIAVPSRPENDLESTLDCFTRGAHAAAGLTAANPPISSTSSGPPQVITQHHVLRGEGRMWEFRIYAATMVPQSAPQSIQTDDAEDHGQDEFHVVMFWSKGMSGYAATKDMFEELVANGFALEDEEVNASAPDRIPANPTHATTPSSALFGTTHRSTTLEGLYLGAGLSTLRPDASGKMHNPYLTTTLLLTHSREVYLNWVPLDGTLSRFRRQTAAPRLPDGSYTLDDDGDTITISLTSDTLPADCARSVSGKVTDDYTLRFSPQSFKTLAPLILLSTAPARRESLIGKTYTATDSPGPGLAALVAFDKDGDSLRWDHPKLGAGTASKWGVDHFTLWFEIDGAEGAKTTRWTTFCTRGDDPDLIIQGERFRLRRAWDG
ncbi:hypothetical protein DFJ77DRAFT_445370 [Powellomyces hirtus]|nr:hypothetical protein DFJ77DRAFT_445370 [Powellomyces hirtus]